MIEKSGEASSSKHNRHVFFFKIRGFGRQAGSVKSCKVLVFCEDAGTSTAEGTHSLSLTILSALE